jgi:hypothetical protein
MLKFSGSLAVARETKEWNKGGINEEYTFLRKYVYYEEEA